MNFIMIFIGVIGMNKKPITQNTISIFARKNLSQLLISQLLFTCSFFYFASTRLFESSVIKQITLNLFWAHFFKTTDE